MAFDPNKLADNSKSRRRKRGNSHVESIDLRTARAHEIALARVEGKSIQALAVKYDCSPSTVNRYIDYAREHGLYLDRARQLIEINLLPKALAIYEAYLSAEHETMTGNDLDAAKDILFGLGILSKSTTVKHASNEDTLESLRTEYFKATAIPAEVAPVAPKGLPEATGVDSTAPSTLTHLLSNESTYDPTGGLADLHSEGDEDE